MKSQDTEVEQGVADCLGHFFPLSSCFGSLCFISSASSGLVMILEFQLSFE